MIPRMSLPENALNVPDFDLAKVETLLTPTKLWTRSEVVASVLFRARSAGALVMRFPSRTSLKATASMARRCSRNGLMSNS